MSKDPTALGEALVVEADVEERALAAWTLRWSARRTGGGLGRRSMRQSVRH
jgi:hypothetical protein